MDVRDVKVRGVGVGEYRDSGAGLGGWVECEVLDDVC